MLPSCLTERHGDRRGDDDDRADPSAYVEWFTGQEPSRDAERGDQRQEASSD